MGGPALPRFGRPKGNGSGKGQSSPNLFIANCGPTVGLSYKDIAAAFGAYGEVKGVFPVDESGAQVVVYFFDEACACLAMETLDGHLCSQLGGRSFHIKYSLLQPISHPNNYIPVSLMASELNILGLYLLHDFFSELLAAVDKRPWKNLSKRRVQHYGYEFCYEVMGASSQMREIHNFVKRRLMTGGVESVVLGSLCEDVRGSKNEGRKVSIYRVYKVCFINDLLQLTNFPAMQYVRHCPSIDNNRF
ncbi:hypothetical protein UlMin_019852 [Ulmus minor]